MHLRAAVTFHRQEGAQLEALYLNACLNLQRFLEVFSKNELAGEHTEDNFLLTHVFW